MISGMWNTHQILHQQVIDMPIIFFETAYLLLGPQTKLCNDISVYEPQ